MAQVTIETNYDGYAQRDTEPDPDTYIKITSSGDISVGSIIDKRDGRGFFRFPLGNLPAGSDVTAITLRVHCHANGGAAHLAMIGAYGSNGQQNPETDGASTCFTRCQCVVPHCYIPSTDTFRAGCSLLCIDGEPGWKEFVLGAQACTDLENAKSAVDRFSIGIVEIGDNDPQVLLTAVEYAAGCEAELVITYTVAAVETIVAKEFPMTYLPKPLKAKELRSKIEGATLTHIAKDFPETLLKKGKAKELRSKWE